MLVEAGNKHCTTEIHPGTILISFIDCFIDEKLSTSAGK